MEPTATTDALNALIRTLYRLNVNVQGKHESRHERPHKPVLLLAALDLIDRRLATPERIVWDDRLRLRFNEIFAVVRDRDDRVDPALPFYHLRSDGFWVPHSAPGVALQRTPLMRDTEVFATIDHGVRPIFASPEGRRELREALISRYFAQHRAALERVLKVASGPLNPDTSLAERLAEARSSAFAELVTDAYDYACAACERRLRVSSPLQESAILIVDAAHLIPFAETCDDDPRNGIALCKICHWTLDKHLIAPSVDLEWLVSPTLDGSRSAMEAELVGLRGKPVRTPTRPELSPRPDALQWRAERLVR